MIVLIIQLLILLCGIGARVIITLNFPSILVAMNLFIIIRCLPRVKLAGSPWLLGLALAGAGCQPDAEEVDLIVHHARVYTVDDRFSQAEAFAVRDGALVAVGRSDDILNRYTASQTLDMAGKTITPGLIDAHCHYYWLGLNQQKVDLVGAKSYQEVLDRVVTFQEEHPRRFIEGMGWDQNLWENKAFPTKRELDSLFPDTPVALRRIDYHALLVNQKALELAGITAATAVRGGEIMQDNGALTGILIDNPMALVDSVIPEPTRAEQIQALRDADRICRENGLTTVNDAGLSRFVIELVDSLQRAGDLSVRMYAMVSNTPDDIAYYLDKGIVKTDRLHVRSVKVFGDGALGSRGAALKAPYSDRPGHYGAMTTSAEDIERLALRLSATDYQMNTHAIGDSTVSVVLNAYQKALGDQTDRRWKVEHFQVVDLEDLPLIGPSVFPSVQPKSATSDMFWAEDRLGAERVKGSYAYRTLLDRAGKIALGTDFPVEPVSPFLTFYAVVSRADVEGKPSGGWRPAEALTREEALRGMTIWAAYSNFEEAEKGSIEVGKHADFVVLSDDIMTVPIAQVPRLRVEQTFIGGEQVY